MKTSAPEIEQQPTSWIARVNLGREMRAAGEQMVATALRERLDKVGEARWLKEVESEWGWSRSTAYRHLNPDQMEAAREATRERREKVPTVGTSKKKQAPFMTVQNLMERLKPGGDLELVEDCAGEKTILQKKVEPARDRDVIAVSKTGMVGRQSALLGDRIAGLQASAKLFPRIIAEVVEKRQAVPIEDYDKVIKSLDKIREALGLVAPTWQCEECDRVLDPDEYEPEPRYECGECGETMRENRCEQCNKFCAKTTDHACTDESCEGEMVRVTWEVAAEKLATQAKEEEEKEAERLKKRKEQEKEQEVFDKSPEGKAQAKRRAEYEARMAAEELKETEDDVLAQAEQITKARAAGITVQEQKRLDKRVADVDNTIEIYLKQQETGVFRQHYLDQIAKFSKAEKARLDAAIAAKRVA